MSSETRGREILSSQDTSKPSKSSIEERDLRQSESESAQTKRTSPPYQKEQSHIPGHRDEVVPEAERKPQASKNEPAERQGAGVGIGDTPRQVIAVSASKGPAAFFNLARKFLVTDEMCDLSALEGAIVSAVDAAHLLERSQLATIVRVTTSYVTVEPKRKKQQAQQQQAEHDDEAVQQTQPQSSPTSGDPAGMHAVREPPTQQKAAKSTRQRQQEETASGSAKSGGRGSSGGRELRRARIVITVQRTESYKQWLKENPLQAMITGNADDNVIGDQNPSDRKQTE